MPRLPIAVTKPKRKRNGHFTAPKDDENLYHFELIFSEELPVRTKKKKAKKTTRTRHSYKRGRTNNVAKAKKY